jgi:hypothetical protein
VGTISIMRSAAICSQFGSQLLLFGWQLVDAMLAFIVLYGSCLPEDWLFEELLEIKFLSGEFTVAAFAEAIAPMARCIPFLMPVSKGTSSNFRTWSWSGPVSCLG